VAVLKTELPNMVNSQYNQRQCGGVKDGEMKVTGCTFTTAADRTVIITSEDASCIVSRSSNQTACVFLGTPLLGGYWGCL